MLKCVEGVFRQGKIELLEPVEAQGDARVLVTFLPRSRGVNLRDLGIDEAQAAEMRARLATFTDWDDPAMDVYDDL